MRIFSTAEPIAKAADATSARGVLRIALIAVLLGEAACASLLYVLLDRRIGRLEALLETWGFNRALGPKK